MSHREKKTKTICKMGSKVCSVGGRKKIKVHVVYEE